MVSRPAPPVSSTPRAAETITPASKSALMPPSGSTRARKPSASPRAMTSLPDEAATVSAASIADMLSARSTPARTAPSSRRVPSVGPKTNAGPPPLGGGRTAVSDTCASAAVTVGASAIPSGPTTNAGTSPWLAAVSVQPSRVCVQSSAPVSPTTRPATPSGCSSDDASIATPRKVPANEPSACSCGMRASSRGTFVRQNACRSSGSGGGAGSGGSAGSGVPKWSPSSPVPAGGSGTGGASERCSSDHGSQSSLSASPMSGKSRPAEAWASAAVARSLGKYASDSVVHG